MNECKETYLIKLLEETKRLIIAENVVKENRLNRFKEPTNESRITDKTAGYELNEMIKNNLLTALMIEMGYRIPKIIYSLDDYSELCDFLGSTEEDGGQRWLDE